MVINNSILAFELPSYETLVAQRPSFFDEAVPAREAAEMMGKTVDALAQMRCRRVGPPFVKVGGSVMYRRRDVLEWLRANIKQTRSA